MTHTAYTNLSDEELIALCEAKWRDGLVTELCQRFARLVDFELDSYNDEEGTLC